jgi:hypothetical protein
MNSPLQALLSHEIQKEYKKLKDLIASLSISLRVLKKIDGTGGKVSVSDLVSYQIGWGKCLIRWYETGIKKEMPEMPGEGFSSWDYIAIAEHFYQKYQYDQFIEQDKAFHEVVCQLLDIVEKEHQTGNLEKNDVWPWCTLPSGKQWPLSKWIRVNSCSPYKRAYLLIKKVSF